MDDRLKQAQQGFDLLKNQKHVQTFTNGCKKFLWFWMWLVSVIPPRAQLSALFIFAALINLIVLLNNEPARGGLALITTNLNAQVAIITFMAIVGWLVALVDRVEILVAGALLWLVYAMIVGYGALTGRITELGYLAFLYLVSNAFATVKNAYLENRLARADDKYLTSIAEVGALIEVQKHERRKPAA